MLVIKDSNSYRIISDEFESLDNVEKKSFLSELKDIYCNHVDGNLKAAWVKYASQSNENKTVRYVLEGESFIDIEVPSNFDLEINDDFFDEIENTLFTFTSKSVVDFFEI